MSSVLNAFRHHRKTHQSGDTWSTRHPRCSTPFGITGKLTHIDEFASKFVSVLNAFRHHRKTHQHLGRTADRGRRCSTPFGITGKLTTYGQLIVRHRPVLNAFRHHRKTHKISARLHFVSIERAQRLSASQENSRSGTAGTFSNSQVLNAFRHHRKTHAARAGDYWRRIRVLNAFRHHRKTHRYSEILSIQNIQCSTPFGITGKLTVSGCRFFFLIVTCSTPFGITGKLTIFSLS